MCNDSLTVVTFTSNKFFHFYCLFQVQHKYCKILKYFHNNRHFVYSRWKWKYNGDWLSKSPLWKFRFCGNRYDNDLQTTADLIFVSDLIFLLHFWSLSLYVWHWYWNYSSPKVMTLNDVLALSICHPCQIKLREHLQRRK